ncbi:MAG TPA: isoprenylcysteine carboxylmethyltransferase family protein [Kofleriaceae bacterium]|nr:isoprenylcysteine carboxylmethyltransferase family protein [Kofleriaceae bacterium]
MKRLTLRAFAGLAFLLAVVGLVLFGAAGTIGYWQAWVFLTVFGGAAVLITIDLAVHDPALLERRVHAGPAAEQKTSQKVIQSLASLAFLATFVLAGLDHRAGWSHIATPLAVAGNVVAAVGLYIVFRVFRANTFTSATIEVAREQQVVTTGPYAIVRHPMYAGALIMMVGVPLALGSWWAVPAVLVLIGVIVWRLLDEENLLATELRGYAEYRTKVKYRLVPLVW